MPRLGDILEFGVDNLLAVFGIELAGSDPLGQFLLGLLEVLHVIDNDESWDKSGLAR